MTSKHPYLDSQKIVTQSLSFQRPDRLPVFDGSLWGEFVDRVRRKYGLPDTRDVEDHYGMDLKVLVAREEFFPTRMGTIRSYGSTVYADDGWGRIVLRKKGGFFSKPVERLFQQPRDLDRLVFDPPGLDQRYDEFLSQVQTHRQKGQAVFVKIGGPFIRGSFFRGEAEFLMDLAEDEGLVRAIVEKVANHLLAIGIESLRRSKAYDFGVWIYDDMCSGKGPMFSPITFERIFLPVYRTMVSALKAAGARWVILHCDGNLTPLLDLLIEAGIDGINPVEHHAGMDVVKLLEKYRERLRFIGGVCNTNILPGGDPGQIRRHVEAIVRAGRDGGLIIGTHSAGPDVSLESYELYRRIVAEKGAFNQ